MKLEGGRTKELKKENEELKKENRELLQEVSRLRGKISNDKFFDEWEKRQ